MPRLSCAVCWLNHEVWRERCALHCVVCSALWTCNIYILRCRSAPLRQCQASPLPSPSSSPSPPSLLSTSSPPSWFGTAVYTLVAHSLAGLSAGTPGTYFPELRSAHLTPTFFASAQHSLASVTSNWSSIQYGPTLDIFLLLTLVESERWVRFYTSEK